MWTDVKSPPRKVRGIIINVCGIISCSNPSAQSPTRSPNREKINSNEDKRSKTEVEKFLSERDQLAKELGKKLKGFDIVKALREMREERKW